MVVAMRAKGTAINKLICSSCRTCTASARLSREIASSEILRVEYRARWIADMLELTVREAFTFFRGAPALAVQAQTVDRCRTRVSATGHTANTLSAGESQRLKLAGFIASLKKITHAVYPRRNQQWVALCRCRSVAGMFPGIAGCWPYLDRGGPSSLMLQAADYLVELGPGPAAAGGRIIATGTPSELATKATPTGQALKKWRKKGS